MSGASGSEGTWRAGVSLIAALCGAAGVGLAAVAAHRVAEPALATAANFLILHAGAVLALAGLSAVVPASRGLLAAASVMLAGVVLFSGDIACRVLLGGSLFPMAAPVGGSTLIASWLIAAASAARGTMTRRAG